MKADIVWKQFKSFVGGGSKCKPPDISEHPQTANSESVIAFHLLTVCFLQDSFYISANKWKEVGLGLGVTDAQIHEMDRKMYSTIEDKTNAILEKWVSISGKYATIRNLANVLSPLGLNCIRDLILENWSYDSKVVFRGQVNYNTISPPPEVNYAEVPRPTINTSYQTELQAVGRPSYAQNSKSLDVNVESNQREHLPVSKPVSFPSVHQVPPVPRFSNCPDSVTSSLQSLSVDTSMEVDKSEDLKCSSDELVLENCQFNYFSSDQVMAKNMVTEFSNGRLEAYDVKRIKTSWLSKNQHRPVKMKVRLGNGIKKAKKEKLMIKEAKEEMIAAMNTSPKLTQSGLSVHL